MPPGAAIHLHVTPARCRPAGARLPARGACSPAAEAAPPAGRVRVRRGRASARRSRLHAARRAQPRRLRQLLLGHHRRAAGGEDGGARGGGGGGVTRPARAARLHTARARPGREPRTDEAVTARPREVRRVCRTIVLLVG